MTIDDAARMIADDGVSLHGVSGARERIEAAHDALLAMNDAVLQFAVDEGDAQLVAACFAKATEFFDVRHRLLAALDERHRRVPH
jgi:hypothetical protein